MNSKHILWNFDLSGSCFDVNGICSSRYNKLIRASLQFLVYLSEKPSLELCKSLIMLRDYNISGRINVVDIPVLMHMLQFWRVRLCLAVGGTDSKCVLVSVAIVCLKTSRVVLHNLEQERYRTKDPYIERDIWCGNFDAHRRFVSESNNFVMMT